MTIIYVTPNNCKSYGETLQNKGWNKVQKLENVSEDKNIIYKVNPLEIFQAKSESCEVTAFSGAFDKSVSDGNTILLEISEENDKHSYVYIGGDKICSFLTNDKIYKYISNMVNNLTPCSIALGWKNIYYLTPNFKFIQKENLNENDIDKLFDYSNISNCQKLKTYRIHSYYQIVIKDRKRS